MALIGDRMERPVTLSAASKYTVMNGVLYLGIGALFIVWPGLVQAVFKDASLSAMKKLSSVLSVFCSWSWAGSTCSVVVLEGLKPPRLLLSIDWYLFPLYFCP